MPQPRSAASASAAAPERRQAAPAEPDLAVLRARIDALDGKLVELINQRAEIARRIGRLKALGGVKPYAPSREREVYARVARLNRGPLSNDAFRAIYREVMSATIALERPTRVCYYGQAGSFTHLAARTKFGASVEYIPARDIRDVFLAVSRGHADYGLVPIENSTEGGVNQSIDRLAETRLKVASEVYLPIHHHLLSHAKPKAIRVLYSHPQAFAQCRNWLTGHLGNVPQKEVGSTAEAAARVARERRAAAVAGELASELYGVPVQAYNIEDQADNITRFFVIAERMAEPTGADKTSLVVSLKDAPGALLGLLRPFQSHGINLTRIESRPSRRRAWEYNFFIDLQGHVSDPRVRRTLAAVEARSRHLEVLGSYPAAPRVPRGTERAAVQARKPAN